MDIWIVAHAGCEHYTIRGIYASHDRALVAWNEVRLEIIAGYQRYMDDPDCSNRWQAHIDILSDENPETCGDGYNDSPSIRKHEVIL